MRHWINIVAYKAEWTNGLNRLSVFSVEFGVPFFLYDNWRSIVLGPQLIELKEYAYCYDSMIKYSSTLLYRANV